MALFTDGPPSTIDDLAAYDSQLLNVASVEGIDVTQKLALARDELGLDLLAMLKAGCASESAAWLAPKSDLGTVVVTPALRLWHVYRTLEMVYSDAYLSQLNDRYSGKRDQFHGMAKWAEGKLREVGIGIAGVPVPRAATPMVTAAGAAAGAALPDGVYYVTVAWLNGAGEEGAPATPADVAVSGGTLQVQAIQAPGTAIGWNVYVGTDPTAMTLQNTAPLAPGETWQPARTVSATGRAPGTGQAPNCLRAAPRMLQRG
jgi:hypothetical protein